MHDTALAIGQRAIEIYAGEKAKILELGSMDVNGSLRQFAPEGASYLGVDLEPGKSVDLVVKPGVPLPFEDEAFDLILASSVFEHDPAFWNTFLDLVRLLKVDGHLYINAPSNGAVHRYPEDHWRFYPDSGLALQRWSCSQDLPVRLIESFTAPRKNDHWNDFVAVFRRGEKEDSLSGRFLHSEVDGTNVWTLGAQAPLKPSDHTEDMTLLSEERKRVAAIDEKVRERNERIAEQESQLKKAAYDAQTMKETIGQRDKEIAKQSAQVEKMTHEQHTFASTLRQREEQVEQIERERESLQTKMSESEALLGEKSDALKSAQDERNKAETQVSALQRQIEELELSLLNERKKAKRAKKSSKSLARELEETVATFEKAEVAHASELSNAIEEAQQSKKKLVDAELSISERFAEAALLTKMLGERETHLVEETRRREWLSRAHAVLDDMPFWYALLPSQMRTQKRMKYVKASGIFDGAQYLELYPDVRDASMDPLRHYMLHGIAEGRQCPT